MLQEAFQCACHGLKIHDAAFWKLATIHVSQSDCRYHGEVHHIHVHEIERRQVWSKMCYSRLRLCTDVTQTGLTSFCFFFRSVGSKLTANQTEQDSIKHHLIVFFQSVPLGMETNLNTKLYLQASLSQERGPVAISQEAGRQPAVQGQLAPVTSGHFSSKPK